MTAKVSGGVTTAYTYNSENQLTNISPTGSAFTYDDTGERIKKTFGTTTTRFVGDLYEDAGGVTKEYVFAGGARVASVSGGAVSAYKYDAQGRRIEKNVSGVVTRYIYDGNKTTYKL